MEEQRGKYRSILLYCMIIIGAFVVGMMIFNYLIMPSLLGRRDVVIVPELVGLPAEIAEERCRESGLEMVTTGSRHSADIPEGSILQQTPGVNEKLKGGRSIRVIVSAGHRMEAVPEVRNKSLRQAELLLSSAGLRRGRVARIFSHEEGQNTVFAVSPLVGSLVQHGSAVDLLLSMRGEPQVYMMPDLTDKDFPFVRDRLEALGFHVSRVVSRRVTDKFPNTILAQTPRAGSSIKAGGTIELVVSTVD